MQEEYDLHLKEMEASMQEQQSRLHEADSKLANCKKELEQQVDQELGITVTRPEGSYQEYIKLVEAERQRLIEHYDQIKKEFDAEFNKKLKQLDAMLVQAEAYKPQMTSLQADSCVYSHKVDQDKADNKPLGKDMWNQLERVSIPVFAGDKSSYHGWRAAFDACIDQAPVSPEYKLLQLKKYLAGEPLNMINKLGHSSSAKYVIAKEKLEKRYGGKRRQIAAHFDELECFKPLQNGNAKDYLPSYWIQQWLIF